LEVALRRALLFACLTLAALPLALRAATPAAAQWYVAGNRYYAQKQYDQALQYFAQSLKLDRRQPAAYQMVGNCYYAKGNLASALQYYRYALQLNPSNTPLAALIQRLSAPADPLGAGRQLYQAQRYREALASFQALAAQQPQNAKAFQYIGNCQYALGDRGAALATYQHALQLAPGNQALSDFITKLTAAQNGTASGDTDWTSPLWRSAILPGWGQAYNGQTAKGLFLGGTTLALWAGEIGSYVVGSAAETQYMNTTGPKADYDGPYNTWSTMATVNHICYVGMTAMYAYTLIDACINAKPVHPSAAWSPNPDKVELSLLPGGASLRWKVAEF
jgi:tetratricopeptide (TPR) repeat protein